MKCSEAKTGRVFILRLEHGDKIPDVIEEFARQQQVKAALVQFIGGADTGSNVVVGPENGNAEKFSPVMTRLTGTSEALGMGTLFTDRDEKPKLHLHAAFGRGRETVTGCTREGVDIWQVGEVIILELTDHSAGRKTDPGTGFEVLEVEN